MFRINIDPHMQLSLDASTTLLFPSMPLSYLPPSVARYIFFHNSIFYFFAFIFSTIFQPFSANQTANRLLSTSSPWKDSYPGRPPQEFPCCRIPQASSVTDVRDPHPSFLWTHCSTMLSEKPHLEWKKIISNINVLAIIAGLLLFFCKIKLPAVILAPINDIGNMLAPLSMIVTGMLMADSPILASLKNAKLYLFSAIRLVIWPTILLLIMCVSHVYEFIPDGRTLLLIVYLASITPSASTITQMVQVYNKDATYSSLLNVFTTLFCIITMPLAVILFSWLIL